KLFVRIIKPENGTVRRRSVLWNVPLKKPSDGSTAIVSASSPAGATVTTPVLSIITDFTKLLCRLPAPSVSVPLPATDGPPLDVAIRTAPVEGIVVLKPSG